MPTKKPTRGLIFSEEDLRSLLRLWKDLRRPGRRGRSEYLGQKVTFNAWLAGLTKKGAEQARADLARADAAPRSGGTVERPMPNKNKTPPPPEATEAAPPSPRRGRPPGRKKITVGLSLDPDVAEYAKALGSSKVNTILRRSMERRGTR